MNEESGWLARHGEFLVAALFGIGAGLLAKYAPAIRAQRMPTWSAILADACLVLINLLLSYVIATRLELKDPGAIALTAASLAIMGERVTLLIQRRAERLLASQLGDEPQPLQPLVVKATSKPKIGDPRATPIATLGEALASRLDETPDQIADVLDELHDKTE